jgi:hypothetical protein
MTTVSRRRLATAVLATGLALLLPAGAAMAVGVRPVDPVAAGTPTGPLAAQPLPPLPPEPPRQTVKLSALGIFYLSGGSRSVFESHETWSTRFWDATKGGCDAAYAAAKASLDEKVQQVRASNPGKVVTVQSSSIGDQGAMFVGVVDGNAEGVKQRDTGTWAEVGKPPRYWECSYIATAVVTIADQAPAVAPARAAAP